jgi:hypothetical protein
MTEKFNQLREKYRDVLSNISSSNNVIATPNWSSFKQLREDRFEILPGNDLLPKTQFYEINRSYQLRNIFVPILTFGFEDEFNRVMQMFSEKKLVNKFEMKPGYFKSLVLSLDFMRDPAKRISPYHVQTWEYPFTYTSHKSACVYCSASRDASAYILKKDYAEFIHRDSDMEENLKKMKETGLYDRQKIKYLNILSKIQSTSQAIATTYWPSFSRDETPFEILSIRALLCIYPLLIVKTQKWVVFGGLACKHLHHC